ncbi:MAG: NEW3 domain-containing protein [Thermoanaerobaculia bacterium]
MKFPKTVTSRCILILLILLAAGAAFASPQNNGDEGRILEVRRRQIELQQSRSKLGRAEELARQGLVSKADLESAQAELAGIQLDYQKSLLAVLNMEPRVSVRRAVKTQSPDGRRFVQLTIANLTPTFDDSQFRMLNNFEGATPIPAALRTRDLRDLFISLKNTGEPDQNGRLLSRGKTLALPYEVHVASLPYRSSRTLAFQLLSDVDSVLVSVAYKGTVQEVDLQLEQAETTRLVDVTSAQISQEADLGGQATYDLRLERPTVDMRSLSLIVLNLPAQVSYSFLDPKSEARLSQITFPAGVAQLPLRLRLFLPDRADNAVKIDQPLDFWVVVAGNDQARQLQADRRYTPEEIQAGKAGVLRLEVIPRGTGRIEVMAGSLFSQVKSGENVETTLKVRNTGTRRLDNVQLEARAPLGWQVVMDPPVVPALGIQQDRDIRLRILPPRDVAVGDYEVRIKADSYANNRQVPSEEKIYRVSIKARSSFWGTGAVLIGLLTLVVGIAISGVKLMRR